VDIAMGFELEEPSVFLPWGGTQEELLALLAPAAPETSAGFIGLSCLILGGLRRGVSLYFRPKDGGRLALIRISDLGSQQEIVESFNELQRHLEATFGRSKDRRPGELGTTSHLWRIGSVRIAHELGYRFGHDEFAYIKAPGQPPFVGPPDSYVNWPRWWKVVFLRRRICRVLRMKVRIRGKRV
jgi:hypothetical protein